MYNLKNHGKATANHQALGVIDAMISFFDSASSYHPLRSNRWEKKQGYHQNTTKLDFNFNNNSQTLLLHTLVLALFLSFLSTK
jgi:hypothetical protein